jgi:putative membrane protein
MLTLRGAAQYLLVIVFLLISGLTPHDGFTWLLECVWILVGLVVLLALNRRGIAPSPLLAWALLIHALILIYGAWYTYERVPLGEWMAETFAWQRNHYDRIGHLAQGFFPALLFREILLRNQVVNGRAWREGLVFACLMAFTGIFELIEFAAAMAFGGGADAYLGSQGDIWDAQWDMLMCALGGLVSIALLSRRHERHLACKIPADAA